MAIKKPLVDNSGIPGELVSGDDLQAQNTIIVPEIASPSTPASGTVKVYAKSDGKVYRMDDAGTEAELGGSGSSPSVISPSQITSDQDDYNPTGFADSTHIRISGDGGIDAITSMSSQSDGETKTFVNVGDYSLYFPGEHPDGTAANRIITGKDLFLLPGDSITFMYDNTSSRWRLINTSYLPTTGNQIYYIASPGSVTAGDNNELFTAVGTTGGAVSSNAAASGFPGYYQGSTSTSATGFAAFSFFKGSNYVSFFGDAHIYAEAVVWFPTLSTAGERYIFEFSISGNPFGTATGSNNSVGIRYNESSSANFDVFSYSNAGASSAAGTGIAVAANTLYVLRVEINKAINEVRAYINNTYAGRVTSNMPSAVACSPQAIIVKSVGTTARTFRMSKFEHGAIYR